MVLVVGLRANRPQRDLASDLAFFQTCNPVLPYVGKHANPCGQIALAIPFPRLTLWENHFQHFNQKLHPRVFFDREQGNDFRASGNQNCNRGGGRGIHERSADASSV